MVSLCSKSLSLKFHSLAGLPYVRVSSPPPTSPLFLILRPLSRWIFRIRGSVCDFCGTDVAAEKEQSLHPDWSLPCSHSSWIRPTQTPAPSAGEGREPHGEVLTDGCCCITSLRQPPCHRDREQHCPPRPQG